jgi:hypothetical protein
MVEPLYATERSHLLRRDFVGAAAGLIDVAAAGAAWDFAGLGRQGLPAGWAEPAVRAAPCGSIVSGFGGSGSGHYWHCHSPLD